MNENDFTRAIKAKYLSLVDFDGAEPSLSCIKQSFMILQTLQDQKVIPSRVSPSVESGIGISFDFPNRFAYIEILNSSEILFLTDHQNNLDRKVWECKFNEPEILNDSLLRIINHLTTGAIYE